MTEPKSDDTSANITGDNPKNDGSETSSATEVTQFPIYLELLAEYPKVLPEAIEAALEFQRVAAFMHVKQENCFGQYGLTSGRFSLLMFLRGETSRSLSPSELAKRADVTRGTMTQFIDGLEKDHLVKRVDDPRDRRAMLVKLTNKGEEVIKKILPEHLNRLTRVTQVLTRTERKTLLSLMEKLREDLNEEEQEKPKR